MNNIWQFLNTHPVAQLITYVAVVIISVAIAEVIVLSAKKILKK